MEHSQVKRQQRGRSIRLVAVLFAAIGCAVLLDISLCQSVNAQSLVNPVFVRPQINSGFVSGNGVQFANTTGCLTAAGVGGQCSNTITFPNAFIDTGFQYICGCMAPQNGVPAIANGNALSTTTMSVTTVSMVAGASSCGAVTCWAWHP